MDVLSGWRIRGAAAGIRCDPGWGDNGKNQVVL
jgi:hypothetical protein